MSNKKDSIVPGTQKIQVNFVPSAKSRKMPEKRTPDGIGDKSNPHREQGELFD